MLSQTFSLNRILILSLKAKNNIAWGSAPRKQFPHQPPLAESQKYHLRGIAPYTYNNENYPTLSALGCVVILFLGLRTSCLTPGYVISGFQPDDLRTEAWTEAGGQMSEVRKTKTKLQIRNPTPVYPESAFNPLILRIVVQTINHANRGSDNLGGLKPGGDPRAVKNR